VTADLEGQNRAIVDHLKRAVDPLIAAYRFGSTANGTPTVTSDVDIAILSSARIPAERRFDVQEALAAQIGCDVDLVDLADTSTVMAMQVIAGGELLYEGDSDARGRFEDVTFSAYARLNEERRGILDRVAAEKAVYGR
jgi:predicted nucleotidyltransferase